MKTDIKHATSARKMLSQFFGKNHYIVVVDVLSFHLSARSSSFIYAFCLQFYGTVFMSDPMLWKNYNLSKKR